MTTSSRCLHKLCLPLALYFFLDADAFAAAPNVFGDLGFFSDALKACGVVWIVMLFDRFSRLAVVLPILALLLCASPYFLLVTGVAGQGLVGVAILAAILMPWVVIATTIIAALFSLIEILTRPKEKPNGPPASGAGQLP